jgi:hypothetical protein
MKSVPFVDLAAQQASIRTAVGTAIQQVLSECNFVLGPQVEEFEANFARFAGCEYAVGVSSGLDALRLALMAVGIGRVTMSSCRPTPTSLRPWPSAPSGRVRCRSTAIRGPITSTRTR